MMPSGVYTNNISRSIALLRTLQRRININSLFRLVSFIAFAFTLFKCFQDFSWVYLIGTVFFFGLFIGLVRLSTSLGKQKSILNKLIFINENELRVLKGESNQFDAGEQFRTGEGYTADLDVFGAGSLFQLVNRCTTVHGRLRLSGLMAQPILDKPGIEKYQQAVKVFSTQVDTRQQVTAGGLLMDAEAESLDGVKEWMQSPSRMIHQPWLMWMRWIFPLLSLASIYYFLDSHNIAPLAGCFVAGWILISVWSKYIIAQHELIDKKQQVLEQYTSILEAFVKADYGSSSHLHSLHDTTAYAIHSIRRLSTLAAYFDQGHNKLVALFLKPFFLYDIHCMVALEKWKESNRSTFASWVESVGDIEAIQSLSAFAFNNPNFSYPQVEESKFQIHAKAMAHPLIASGERVVNDFSIGENEKLQLITGSNMSGKTTFLRTVGVNLILAQCGAPVCAEAFGFCPMPILTSIRISDSLQEHTSYFMAELKRLHGIVEHLEAGRPALVLIDEILRGTNSEDKTHGSEQFIRKLIRYRCLSLFATHDLTLSTLSSAFPGEVNNFCFESSIRDGELYFDYKLQSGVAKNKNASFLMQKMGIIG